MCTHINDPLEVERERCGRFIILSMLFFLWSVLLQLKGYKTYDTALILSYIPHVTKAQQCVTVAGIKLQCKLYFEQCLFVKCHILFTQLINTSVCKQILNIYEFQTECFHKAE